MRLRPFLLCPLVASLSVIANAQQNKIAAENFTEADYAIEEIFITGVRENRNSKGATGLDLSIKETPQSISILSRDLLDNFAASNLNDALKLATGIQVEAWETNRTNYMSRGFEIKNTQIDGVGMPNSWGIVTSEMDTFAYEQLEVIRGANGLLTGVGNASGTINYVRKRPTNEQEGSLGISAGSFDFKRLQADYSTPFTETGTWAGRVVVAAEDKASHLRGYENDRVFFYGVVDGQLTDNSTLAAGYSHQKNESTGNMWGALVLEYSDETQANFPRSSSTAQDWSMWDTTNDTAFVEYVYNLSADWTTKFTYNHRESENADKLFYVTGPIDKETGLGLQGLPGNWPDNHEEDLFDLSLNGNFSLGGKDHQLVLGYSYSESEFFSFQRPHAGDPSFPLPPFPYAGDVVPEPVWGPKILQSTNFQELTRVYGSAKLNITDKLATILGFNHAEYSRNGENYSVPFDQTERETSPYVGLTYNITDSILAYASYSDIYQPQDQQDIFRRYLAPSKGVNYEAGVRWEITPSVMATLARFKADQQDLGTYAGENAGRSYYEGVDVYSEGSELEVVGQISELDQISLGFVSLQLDGEDGESLYRWVPRQTINLNYSRQLNNFPQLRVGVGAKYQSETEKDGANIRQSSYTTMNLFAAWDINDSLNVQFNANNVTDEKYLTSLYYVGYYSAPANYTLSANYSF